MPFAVDGKIGTRWREWGGADGPFGAALSGEDSIAGTAGRRQRFERGEMVWAPEQDMLVSVFRLQNLACFSWSRPHFEHDHFRINSWFDGQPQGLDNTSIKTTAPHALHRWLGLQERGDLVHSRRIILFRSADQSTPVIPSILGELI